MLVRRLSSVRSLGSEDSSIEVSEMILIYFSELKVMVSDLEDSCILVSVGVFFSMLRLDFAVILFIMLRTSTLLILTDLASFLGVFKMSEECYDVSLLESI